MKICPSCRIRYPDEAQACGSCGARLMLDASSQPDPQLSLVGRVIGGNYRVERLLGKGGMGAVFRARQLSLDREVAIKVLLAPLAMEGEMIERFQREARSASNIGHPGIVQVIDLGYLEEGPPFIAMELLEGEDLRSKLHREGALPPAQAIPLVLQVCDALQAAHDKGIVHRDLKPDNIFLVYRRGKVPMVKLLDFGLSKIKSAERKLTNTGALLGTPNYMSPEQVKADREVDHRTDIYATGAILYEMLTGRPAYDGASVQSILVSIMTEDPSPPRRIRPELPEALEAIILRAMARDPALRHQAMNELGVDLARTGGALGVSASQLSLFSTPSSPSAPVTPPPGQAMPVATPQVTPAPVSVPASAASVARPARGPGRLIIAGVLGIIAIPVLAIVVGALALVVFALRGKEMTPEEEMLSAEAEELKKEIRQKTLEGIFEGFEAALEPAGDDETADDASSRPGSALGRGMNPHVCCGGKGCGAVWQVEEEEGVIHFARLDGDLKPMGGSQAISPDEETSRWPTCFARQDGGYIVFYQESRDPFDMSAEVNIHRLVISAGGKPAERRTSVIRNMISVDEFEATYAAARSGDAIVLVWNHMKDVSSGIRFSVFDMDGEERKTDVIVHGKPWVHATSLACNEDRCLVAWTRPSLPMNHIRKFSIITPGGKVLEEDLTVWDRGVLVANMSIVPMSGGAAMAWVERSSKGATSQWIAFYGWDGKERLAPARIDEFGGDFTQNEHLGYLAGSPESTLVALTRPRSAREGEPASALTLLIDAKGKVMSKSLVSVPDEDVYDSSVFLGPDGKPLVVYGTGSWASDQELYIVPPKSK